MATSTFTVRLPRIKHQICRLKRSFTSSCIRNSHYNTLGVQQNATKAQIKSHFYKLSKVHHPDVSRAPESKAIYLSASEAYQVLSNDRERRAYDRELEQIHFSPASATAGSYHPRAPAERARRATHAWQNTARSSQRAQAGAHTHHPAGRTRPPPGQHYSRPPPTMNYHRIDPYYRSPSARRQEEEHREMDKFRDISGPWRAMQVFGIIFVCFTIFGGTGQ